MEIGIYMIRECPFRHKDEALYELGQKDGALIWIEVVAPNLATRRDNGENIDYPRIIHDLPNNYIICNDCERATIRYDEREYNEAWEKWASQRLV